MLISVYAYQGAITAVLFNGRTRALVSLLTGLGSITGSIIIGLLTDKLPFKRRNRAVVSCLIVFLLTAAVWGAGLGFQVQFNRNNVALGTIFKGEPLPWDLKMSSAAGGPITLLMACECAEIRCGFGLMARLHRRCYLPGTRLLHHVCFDQRYVQPQSPCLSLTSRPLQARTNGRLLQRYPVRWSSSIIRNGRRQGQSHPPFTRATSNDQTPYLTEHLVSWLMLVISLPLCGYVLWSVRDTNYDVEGVVHAEDVDKEQIHGAAVPTGHHLHDDPTTFGNRVVGEDKKEQEVYTQGV
jgi:hypothetical protein